MICNILNKMIIRRRGIACDALIRRFVAAACLSVAATLTASGQATSTSAGLTIRTIAEVVTHVTEAGHDVTHLRVADRVAPGDEVIYTLEIRNTSGADLRSPTVVNPLPVHTQYVADSASGPGAEISFSADGGRSFRQAEYLDAKPSDYTHIRWQLRNNLKSHSVAYARFRAVVK
jgi:uncharacterized repeat protein (TIGR01451 family)